MKLNQAKIHVLCTNTVHATGKNKICIPGCGREKKIHNNFFLVNHDFKSWFHPPLPGKLFMWWNFTTKLKV